LGREKKNLSFIHCAAQNLRVITSSAPKPLEKGKTVVFSMFWGGNPQFC
jgi:hypothetical protein